MVADRDDLPILALFITGGLKKPVTEGTVV